MTLVLRQVPGDLWVSKAEELDPALIAQLEDDSPQFWTVTRTLSEVSIVSGITDHPSFTSVEGPWSGFGIVGTLDFSLTGILARCSTLLAEAEISLFAVSSYDTDYFLVRSEKARDAIEAWRSGGLTVEDLPTRA